MVVSGESGVHGGDESILTSNRNAKYSSGVACKRSYDCFG